MIRVLRKTIATDNMIHKNVEFFYNKLVETKIIYFLIGFAILISYYLLYIFRAVDNTVLMSWNLVFYYGDINIYELLFVLSIAIFISFIISRLNIFNKYNKEKYHILFLFFSGMIIGSLFWNIPEINPDAARYFQEAKYLEVNGVWSFLKDWGKGFFVWTDSPSAPFFYGIIFRYFGEYREYIQIFNTILFSLTSVLTYKISRKLWNEEIGLYSSLFLLSFPFLLSQVPLMLVDITLMFLTIMAVFLILKIFDSKYYAVPESITVFFAVYTKMSSLLFILPPAISIIYINYKTVLKNKYRWIFTIVFSLVIIILFFSFNIDIFLGNLQTITKGRPEGNRYFESELNYLYQIGSILIILALFSILVAYRKKDKNFLILIAWIVIPFLIFHNIRIRQMISVFPVIAIMASLSLSTISYKPIKKYFSLSLVLASIAFTIYAYIPYEENFTDRNIKDAAEFTNPMNIPEIEIFLDFSENHSYNPDPMVLLFDLYSHKKIVYSDDNKFYPVADFSNSWLAHNKIPPVFYEKSASNSSRNERIIMIISDKVGSGSIPIESTKDHILTKKFDHYVWGILNPASVQVYLPQNQSI